MTNLSSLSKMVDRSKKRLGRGGGSGKGAKSGRGTTRHQAAREKIKLWFEGGQNRMTKKFPLLRGKSKNKSIKENPVIIDFKFLESLPNKDIIDIKFLVKSGLLDKLKSGQGVKLLARGELKKAFIVKIPMSKAAKEVIIKMGGQVKNA